MRDNDDNVNKPAAGSGFRSEIRSDVEANVAKFNDPVVLGELMYKLVEERENTNRILKNILAKLEALERPGLAISAAAPRDMMLPEVDERIMAFIRERGKAGAEEVREAFGYKGKNAACARLNRLYEMSLLEKKQVGKKVFFFPL